MCGVQSLISLLLFSSHANKQVSKMCAHHNTLKYHAFLFTNMQVYSQLNHINACISYPATLRLVEDVSKLHSVPLERWIAEGITFKFIGDNVDKKMGVRDVRIDNQGDMLHMYSLLAARSRLPLLDLPRTGQVEDVASLPWESFLPTQEDIDGINSNLVVLVSRLITQYFSDLSVLSKSVPSHIKHKYSQEMSKKSEVVVLDVFMKNEATSTGMLDIMKSIQDYLGENYPSKNKVASGGDQLTCERQAAAMRHMMDGDTAKDRLQLLEPQSEDWHCMVCMLKVSLLMIDWNFLRIFNEH